jgi:hypothetical protein
MPSTRITTCNYCGNRAALVLSGTTRHELACSSCGAPLHDIKHLKSSKPHAHPKTTSHDPWGKSTKSKPKKATSDLTKLLNHPTTHKAARKILKSKKRKRKSGLYLAVKILGDLLD